MVARIRGAVLIIVFLVLVLALGFGIVYGIGTAAGGISTDISIFYGFVLVLVVFGVLFYFGRRRQKKAQAERAQQAASRVR